MSAKKASSTHFWTEEETEFMLHQMRELNILKFMDGRRTRNGSLYVKIAAKMEKVGFVRTPEQIKIKWKNTRAAYTNAKRNHGRSACPHFAVLEELLGRRAPPEAGGVEVGGVEVGGVEDSDQGELLEPLVEPAEMWNHEEPQQNFTEYSPGSPRTSSPPGPAVSVGTGAQQPRRRPGGPGGPGSFAQLCLEVEESRALLLQELRESGRYLRELTGIMRQSREDHNRNMAALLEVFTDLRRPPTGDR